MTDELALKILAEIAAPGSGHLFSRRGAAAHAIALIEQQAARIAELEARIAANGAEPVAWQSPSGWLYDDNPNGFADWTPLYAAPVASGPRYDWTTSGMKQSETGNWVMAGSAEKTGE